MSNHEMPTGPIPVRRPLVPRMVRVLAVPIIVFWAFLAVTTNTFVPQVERLPRNSLGR